MAAAVAGSSRLAFPLQDLRVEEFSGDCFPDELYLVTNEIDQRKTFEILRIIRGLGNTYLGTSGLYNLNIASVRDNIKYIVIFDRSEVVKLFWEKMGEIITQCGKKQEAYKRIYSLVLDNHEYFFGKAQKNKIITSRAGAEFYLRKLDDEFRDGLSFLSDDIRYAKIRDIFLKDNFRFLRMDLENSESFVRLEKDMRSNGLDIDILYLSNTKDYCEKNAYVKSVQNFLFKPDNKPLFIDASRIRTRQSFLVQRIREIPFIPDQIKQILVYF